MNILDNLAACTGVWSGISTLHLSDTKPPEDSPSSVMITPVLGGRFVRLDYTWVYQGAPQEGLLLIGFDAGADAVTAYWIDTWHMGDKAMTCTGPRPEGAALRFQGSYQAPPGPDWGWRIEIAAEPAGELRMTMFNIWPGGGREAVAVAASYRRLSGRSPR